MSMSDLKNIKYIFIGSLSDKIVMHQESYENLPSSEKDAKQIFDRMCSISSTKFNEQSKVSNKNGKYYFTSLSPDKFYLILASNNYNETNVFSLISEIHDSSIMTNIDTQGKIKSDGKQYLKILVDKYQKKSGAIKEINNDINDIKLEMGNNIRSIVSNQGDLNGLNKQSDDIKQGSDLFQQNAVSLKKAAWWQNFKYWIIIVLVVIVLLVVIIVPIVVSNNSSSDSSSTDTVNNSSRMRLLNDKIAGYLR